MRMRNMMFAAAAATLAASPAMSQVSNAGGLITVNIPVGADAYPLPGAEEVGAQIGAHLGNYWHHSVAVARTSRGRDNPHKHWSNRAG